MLTFDLFEEKMATHSTPKQRATVQEACPTCKNLFSKISIDAHLDAKQRIDDDEEFNCVSKVSFCKGLQMWEGNGHFMFLCSDL